jgi:hypothetical protein
VTPAPSNKKQKMRPYGLLELFLVGVLEVFGTSTVSSERLRAQTS